MISELKELWIRNLNDEREDIAEWVFDTYLPKLYLYDNGSIWFCSQKPLPLFKTGYIVVIDLKPLQDELSDWFYSETKDLSEAEKDRVYREMFIDNFRTDDYVMEKILDLVRSLDKITIKDYPVYISI